MKTKYFAIEEGHFLLEGVFLTMLLERTADELRACDCWDCVRRDISIAAINPEDIHQSLHVVFNQISSAVEVDVLQSDASVTMEMAV